MSGDAARVQEVRNHPRTQAFVPDLVRFGMPTGRLVKNRYLSFLHSGYDRPIERLEPICGGMKMISLSARIACVLGMMCLFVSSNMAQTNATSDSPAPGILPSSFGKAVDHDVMTIRDAISKFKSTGAAEAAGYKQVTGCVQHQPAGAMGYHFQNNELLDTTLDLEHPEVLVYEKMPDGSFQLNGVEFLVPISAWKSAEPPRIMGQALIKADPIGFWFLHVWTSKPNPSGLFAPWNPDVKCLEASPMSH
jgi:hypothetical protein